MRRSGVPPLFTSARTTMHTNQKIFDLATKNSQRSAASAFLTSLSGNIKAVFEKAALVYHPQLSELFAPIIHRAIELHKLGEISKGGANALMTCSKEKALTQFFQWISNLPEGDYVLVLGGGNGVSFNGQMSWVSGLPGYVVQIPEAIEALKALSQSGFEQVSIASRNTQHAVVLETSSGFLPNEPSKSAAVYARTSW